MPAIILASIHARIQRCLVPSIGEPSGDSRVCSWFSFLATISRFRFLRTAEYFSFNNPVAVTSSLACPILANFCLRASKLTPVSGGSKSQSQHILSIHHLQRKPQPPFQSSLFTPDTSPFTFSGLILPTLLLFILFLPSDTRSSPTSYVQKPPLSKSS